MLTLPLKLEEINPQIRNMGMEKSCKWGEAPRRIYDHEMLYCHKGKGTIDINHRSYPVKPGTLFIIKPNTPHCFNIVDSDEIYWVHFDYTNRQDINSLHQLIHQDPSSLFSPHLKNKEHIRPDSLLHHGKGLEEYIEVDNQDYIAELFSNLLHTFTSTDDYRVLDCKVLLLTLFSYLLKNHGVKISTPDLNSLYPCILHYIQQHFHEDITLKSLSLHMGYSQDYISRTFKKYSGVKLNTYLHEIRLNHAIKLLEDTSLTANEISGLVGYKDPCHFSKSMRKYKGTSPSQLRQT